MSSLVTVEQLEKFTPNFLEKAAEEAFILRDYPPYNDGMALTHDFAYIATDTTNHDGYLCIEPVRIAEADEAFREEAPALHEIIATLQTMPSSFGATIPARNPHIILNFSQPGGLVSRHIDSGNNTRNWIGRCISLTSTGLIRFYADMDSTDIMNEVPVRTGDITNHFNHANKNQRYAHDIVNTGTETRVSVGLLVALKAGILGRQRAEQQTAHATLTV